MDETPLTHPVTDGPRLMARLERMLAAGRITSEEAARLRTASGTDELDREAKQIRMRHFRAQVNAALADGRLSRSEAEALLDRLAQGESPRVLSGLLAASKGQARD
jgi:hypothetical protein